MLTGDGRVVLIDATALSFASDKTVGQTAMLTPGYAPLKREDTAATLLLCQT